MEHSAHSGLKPKLGQPVCGKDFWPRPDVVDALYADLAEGVASRSLFGLRRIGKSSVLMEVEDRLRRDPALVTVRVDVQGVSRFRDFLEKIFSQLPITGRLAQARKLVAGNRVVQALLPAVWARLTGTAGVVAQQGFQNEFDHMSAWAGEIEAVLAAVGPMVLMIDELPYMLRNMMRDGYRTIDVEKFLAVLRSWRMNGRVRMLVAGSIGLGQLGRLDGVSVADHVGDLPPVPLPPLARPDAVAMVDALARGTVADWNRSLSEAVVDGSAETWPLFLQYGFDAVRRSGQRDPAAVPGVIDADVRQVLDETFYKQFTTRLARYGVDQTAARVALKAVVANHPRPSSLADLDQALGRIDAIDRRDDLLEALREDDFIRFDTAAGTVQAASRLVPTWVRARSWGR